MVTSKRLYLLKALVESIGLVDESLLPAIMACSTRSGELEHYKRHEKGVSALSQTVAQRLSFPRFVRPMCNS